MAERALAIKTNEVNRENSTPQIRRAEHSLSRNSPVDRILFLQGTIGNQAVQRLIRSGALQTKLRADQLGDIYERTIPDFTPRVAQGRRANILARLLAGEPDREKPALPAKSAKKPSTKGAVRQEECGKKCGGTELGSVECELNLGTGLPTDKVRKEIRDKDPCTSPCVDMHETVHVTDIEPICKQVHKCLIKAGDDTKKQDKCLDTYEADLWAKVAGSTGTECAAYRAEEQCMKKRESAPECKTKEGQSRWTAHLSRTKCYKDCYCSK